MPAALSARLTAQQGVISTRDLRELGLSTKERQALVSAGVLVRVRRSAFVDGQVWRDAPPWERHRLRALAVMRGLGDQRCLVLTQHSAVAVHGFAVHGVDDLVHLGRTDAGRSRSDEVVQVQARVPEDFVQERHGCRLVTPAMASLQVAAESGVEAGLVSAESALHRQFCTSAELREALAGMPRVKGRAAARRVVELAGALSESAAESRCRWLFMVLGLPPPVQQAWIQDRGGVAVGRVDFLFAAERVIVEFDGLGKYADVGVLHREKIREDRLRELGYEVVRLTWADLDDPEKVLQRLRDAMDRAAARRPR